MQYCFISVKEQRHTVQAKIIDHFRQTVFFTVYHIFRRPQRRLQRTSARIQYIRTDVLGRQHSIVFGAQFKISLGMLADRTHLRCGASTMDMAAIAANPDHFPAPFEHKAFLNILHKAQISLFMRLFDVCHTFEQECRVHQSLLPVLFWRIPRTCRSTHNVRP